MGLRNDANLWTGHPAAIVCQPFTIIGSPCLGALDAIFWETKQGAGGSGYRLRGM